MKKVITFNGRGVSFEYSKYSFCLEHGKHNIHVFPAHDEYYDDTFGKPHSYHVKTSYYESDNSPLWLYTLAESLDRALYNHTTGGLIE